MRTPGWQSLIQFIPKVFYWVKNRTPFRPVLPHQSHSLMSSWSLCTGAQSYWNKKGPSSNQFHKFGSMKVFKMFWYAEALQVPFNETKQQLLKNNPLQTLHLAQCSQTSTVPPATAKLRLVHQTARRRSQIPHSREMLPLLQSPVEARFTIWMKLIGQSWRPLCSRFRV